MAGESKTTLESVVWDGRRELPRKSKGIHQRLRIKGQRVFIFPRCLRYRMHMKPPRATQWPAAVLSRCVRRASNSPRPRMLPSCAAIWSKLCLSPRLRRSRDRLVNDGHEWKRGEFACGKRSGRIAVAVSFARIGGDGICHVKACSMRSRSDVRHLANLAGYPAR